MANGTDTRLVESYINPKVFHTQPFGDQEDGVLKSFATGAQTFISQPVESQLMNRNWAVGPSFSISSYTVQVLLRNSFAADSAGKQSSSDRTSAR